jgi:hypothetical protein
MSYPKERGIFGFKARDVFGDAIWKRDLHIETAADLPFHNLKYWLRVPLLFRFPTLRAFQLDR